MNEEQTNEEAKFEPDLTKLETDDDDKYIVTEDLDPTPIQYGLIGEDFNMLPERYKTRKLAEKAMAKLDGEYTIAETR